MSANVGPLKISIRDPVFNLLHLQQERFGKHTSDFFGLRLEKFESQDLLFSNNHGVRITQNHDSNSRVPATKDFRRFLYAVTFRYNNRDSLTCTRQRRGQLVVSKAPE